MELSWKEVEQRPERELSTQTSRGLQGTSPFKHSYLSS